MRRHVGLVTAIVFLTLLAGMVGGWPGVRRGLAEAARRPTLDESLHRELHLTASQGRIQALEADFAPRRRTLEAEMQAANLDLAHALVTQHALGPDAERAIGRFHVAMRELQKQTVVHVMAMRQVLTPEQAHHFDAIVSQSLTSERP